MMHPHCESLLLLLLFFTPQRSSCLLIKRNNNTLETTDEALTLEIEEERDCVLRS
jgi:hypothetical protein